MVVGSLLRCDELEEVGWSQDWDAGEVPQRQPIAVSRYDVVRVAGLGCLEDAVVVGISRDGELQRGTNQDGGGSVELCEIGKLSVAPVQAFADARVGQHFDQLVQQWLGSDEFEVTPAPRLVDFRGRAGRGDQAADENVGVEDDAQRLRSGVRRPHLADSFVNLFGDDSEGHALIALVNLIDDLEQP